MDPLEELKLREEKMKQKEDELNKELLHWKNRCLSVEEKVKEVTEKVEKMDEVSSQAPVPNANTEDIKSIINLLHTDIQHVNEGFTGLQNKTSNLFTALKNDFSELKQLVEEGKQYSQLNNILIHGFPSVPNFYGIDFIYSIVDKMNELFPSLPGPILPCQIDDAHPLRTRNRSSKKVVIVRFSNRWMKDILMKCRHDLEGTGLMLTEHLTDFTQKLRSDTAKIVGAVNTSVHKTRVYAKCNGKFTPIKSQKDLDKLKEFCVKYPSLTVVPEHVSSLTHSSDGRGTNSHHSTR